MDNYSIYIATHSTIIQNFISADNFQSIVIERNLKMYLVITISL